MLSLSKNKDICPTCQNTVTSNDSGLCCDECKQWLHAKCCDFSDDQYEWLARNDSLSFSCSQCRNIQKKGEGEVSNAILYKQMQEMMAGMNKLLENHSKMEQVNAKLTERVDKLEALIEKRKEDKFPEDIKRMVAEKVEEVVSETRAKDDRKLNLILVNVPESTGEGQKEKDAFTVRELMRKILPDEEAKVEEPVRLGKTGAQPRMIKFKVNSLETKKRLLKNASKLNDGTEITDPKKRLYLNNDYTATERKINKELRQKLKEKEESERIKYTIRGGKIVLKEKQTEVKEVDN